MTSALVVGAGPAGLMAAEALADAGLHVTVADQKPSVGRKFLMAGKSGLNITKNEDPEAFVKAFQCVAMAPMIAQFGPEQAVAWAHDLEQETFVGSSGRVFPKAMKASPLLRAWLARLNSKGVVFQTGWAWRGFDGSDAIFDTLNGAQSIAGDVTVLALGGASWKRLGSDGLWAESLSQKTPLVPFLPSNMGLAVNWSSFMEKHFGTPVKNIRLTAGAASVQAEAVVTKTGIEGGGVYAVSAAVRDGVALTLDLLPALSEAVITERLAKPRGKESLSNMLRKRLKLDPVKIALLNEFGKPLPDALAGLLKALPVKHEGPAPIDGAISTAGGVAFEGLDAGLMIKALPGVFVAGEMLDWEAPTGGYLITACLATGLWAGQNAARWAQAPVAAT